MVQNIHQIRMIQNLHQIRMMSLTHYDTQNIVYYMYTGNLDADSSQRLNITSKGYKPTISGLYTQRKKPISLTNLEVKFKLPCKMI